jgi:hypothetical protein
VEWYITDTGFIPLMDLSWVIAFVTHVGNRAATVCFKHNTVTVQVFEKEF